MSTKYDPVYANAYTVVTDEPTATATAVVSKVAKLDLPLHTVSPQFCNIPETHNLVWADDFFEDDDDIVAVFDCD